MVSTDDRDIMEDHGKQVIRNVSLLLLALCLSSMLAGRPAFATDSAIESDIASLVAVDTALDGKQVIISGEAVGVAYAGDDEDHEWVNLTADGSTIGVYMTTEEASRIKNFGSYGIEGSTLSIEGIYHVACDDGHGGELDIHATSVEVVDEGGTIAREAVSTRRWVIAGSLVVIGLCLLVATVTLRHKEK